MTPDSAASSPAERGAAREALLPETLARLGRLEVRAQRVVDGFLSGRHGSPYLGRSLEFREHRQYTQGDDPRHVDWKVWGRQDRLYVKQYEAETNLRATLLVDASGSMAYRSDTTLRPTKHDYAATAALALAYLLARQHDAVGCVTFAEGVLREAPPRTGRAHVARVAEALVAPAGGAKTGLRAALERGATVLAGRGIVALFSDLLAPVEELTAGLALLRSRGADPVVLHVMDDDELDFPFEGPTEFVDLEGERRLEANPRALRKRYLAALAAHLAAVRAACAAERADYTLLRTSQPLDAALVALLAVRSGRRARGGGTRR